MASCVLYIKKVENKKLIELCWYTNQICNLKNQDNYLMFQGSQAFCMHWGLWNYTIGWGNANKTA